MAWFEHLNISPQCQSIIIDQVQSLALEQKHIIQCSHVRCLGEGGYQTDGARRRGRYRA